MTYGLEQNADWVARDVRPDGTLTEFSVSRRGQGDWLKVRLNLPGRHNVQNALAAIAVASELGVDRERIRAALAAFQGIGRRSEVLGEIVVNGARATIVDDYAHHPGEITAVLAAMRTAWPGRRIVTVFQPHRFTRTRDLFAEFCRVLSGADALVLLEVYPAGEAAIAGADGASLCRGVEAQGGAKPVLAARRQDVAALLPGLVRDGDLLLILGAGDIGMLGTELMSAFGK
jgi:UDP-N-acetylmuramate--alanine ligase